jgi:FAD:protein FMN transferase
VSHVALALEAMATRFELILGGDDRDRLRAAGEEALAEIERADAQLSRYRPSSEIAWINARAGSDPVRVDPRVLGLLERCRELWHLTDGAFDVTVGPLLRAYGFVGGSGSAPLPGARERARALVGMEAVELDRAAVTVRLPRRGMELDLGAVGKGYALDRAIAVLREHGVARALLHGGTSSVHSIGTPAGGGPWRIAWRVPGRPPIPRRPDPARPALSVSAVHGKGFAAGGSWSGHVLDPRRGAPTRAAVSACVVGPSSLLCDALSTALLVNGPAWSGHLAIRFPGYEGWTAQILREWSGPRHSVRSVHGVLPATS